MPQTYLQLFADILLQVMKLIKKAALLLLPILFLIPAVGDYFYYQNRLYPGIYLHQVPVGGLTEDGVNALLEELQITFTTGGAEPSMIGLKTLGLRPTAGSIFAQAYPAGRSKAPPFSYAERLQLLRRGKHLSLYQSIDQEQLGHALAALEAAYSKDPRDAAFHISTDSRRLKIVPEAAGFRLNRQQLAQIMAKLLTEPDKKLLVTLPGTPVRPSVTAAMLGKRGIREPVGAFTTTFDGYAEDRVHNIRLAVSHLNFLQLAPGETFSFNEVLGDSTPEKGYRKAPIIVGTDLVAGYGGGLCQVSTTLYNAALHANLEIVERHNHNMAIPYIHPGRDATISYGSRDLSFRNNTGHYLLIHGTVTANELAFSFFGTPSGKRVVIEPKILSTTPYPIKHVEDPGLPAGREEITDGEPGYQVAVWKTVWLGSEMLSHEQISLDNYEPFRAVIKKGTGPHQEGD